MRLARRTAIVAIAAVALLAVGCGSDAKPAANKITEIKIAIAAPLAGDYATYGKPIEDGEKQAADEIAAAGGVASGPYKGAKITIVPFDDQLDAKQDGDIAQKVVDDPSIWAFTGLAASDGALAAKPILARSNVALVSSYASSPDITKGTGGAFIIASPHAAYAGAGVAEAKAQGSSKVAILQITGAFGDSISGLAQKDLTAKGLSVTTVQSMNTGDADVKAQVLAAHDSGADTLMTVGYASDVVAALKGADAISWKPKLIDAGGGAFDPSVLKNAAAAAEGLTGVVDYDAGSTSAANQKLVTAYAKANSGSKDVPPPYAHGYETVTLIAKALESGPKDRTELAAAIAKVTLDETGVGKLRFDATGNPLDRPMWIFTVKAGKFEFTRGYTFGGSDVTPLSLQR
ncbi:MAG: ABC transporter substrate-binding protein [Acidimicrobiales bacterium]